MPYAPDLHRLLQDALVSTPHGVDDLLALELGDWHVAVLLDSTQYLSAFDPLAINDRELARDTPLDIAYRLNRCALIEALEALGAVGDRRLMDWPGVGIYMPHDKYIHLPARQGKVKTLETRYRLGASLNDRDVHGNTPMHWLAGNGHFKAVKYFAENYRQFGLDINAKNHEGQSARNVAMLAGHPDIAQQLLIREIDNYQGAARLWHEMSAGWE